MTRPDAAPDALLDVLHARAEGLVHVEHQPARVARFGTQTTFFRLGEDPGLGRFLDALARRVGGTVVAPDVDDLGAAVVGRFLHSRRGRASTGDPWNAGGRWAV